MEYDEALSYLLTVIPIRAVAVVTAAFLGRRVRDLEPVNMITEE